MTEMVSTLIEQLYHPDRNWRSQAALSLGKLGDQEALSALLEALYIEADFFVREDITWALVKMGKEAVPPLIDLLSHQDPIARYHAAHTLSKIGDLSAIDALIKALEDEDVRVITKSAFALAQSGDVRVIPSLVQLLGHEDRELQTTIHQALERFGSLAVPLIAPMLKHKDWRVREQSADVLGLIGDQMAVPVLIAGLEDDYWQVRFAVVTALSQFELKGERAALRLLADDAEPRVRSLVLSLLKDVEGA